MSHTHTYTYISTNARATIMLLAQDFILKHCLLTYIHMLSHTLQVTFISQEPTRTTISYTFSHYVAPMTVKTIHVV